MVSHNNIGLTLVSPESLLSGGNGDDWLKLEQKNEPDPPAGGFMGWLQAKGINIFKSTIADSLEYQEKYKSRCAEDGCLEIEMQVHKSRPDLEYTFTVSYGELTERFVHTGEHIRSETIRMKSEIDLGVLLVGDLSADWEGQVLNIDREVIPGPEVTVTGSILSWGIKVAGVLRIKFSEEHDAYIVTITPRPPEETDPEEPTSAYQSTVFAVWGNGEVEDHEISLPEIKGFCGASVRVDPDDPDSDCWDLYVDYHKCTGEVLNEKFVPVACPDPGDEDEDGNEDNENG